MLKILSVIYVCWTPQDSLELAVKHGYILVKSTEIKTTFPHQLREWWYVQDTYLEVNYQHPLVGNRQNWCYFNEKEIQ